MQDLLNTEAASMSTHTAPPSPKPQDQPRPAEVASQVIETSASAQKPDTAQSGKAHFTNLEESRPSRFGFVWWIVIAIIAGAGWYYSSLWLPRLEALFRSDKGTSGMPTGPRATTVNAVKVTEQDLNIYLNGLGTVTAFNTVTLRSRIEGEVINVHFNEGQLVKAGDLLIEIDPRHLETLRDQALAQLRRDEATLKLAELNLSREEGLLKLKATSPQSVDNFRAQVDQAKASILSDQATIENAELQLAYCKITSPITGRIGLRLVDQGNIVQANSTTGLAVITQVEPITLLFTIPQSEIPRVQRQMQINGSLPVEAFDRDFRTKLSDGVLSAFDNQVDASTGTLRLKATFANKDHTLFPNQFVNARMLVETLPNSLLIPNAAIQRGATENFVFVVLEDDTVEIRPVTLGPTEGSLTAVLEGVKSGEWVVTNGLDKLKGGSKVAIAGRAPASGKPGDRPDHSGTKAAPGSGPGVEPNAGSQTETRKNTPATSSAETGVSAPPVSTGSVGKGESA